MTIPDIQAALNDLGNQLDRIEKLAITAQEDINELRNQLGVERYPTAEEPVNRLTDQPKEPPRRCF